MVDPNAVDPNAGHGQILPESRPPRAADIEHPQVAHEETDLSFAIILLVLVVAGSTVLFTAFAVFELFWWHERTADAREAMQGLPIADQLDRLPKQPRLEQIDRVSGFDMSNVFLQEAKLEHLLATYGKTNEEGFVHIPIEKAMALAVGRLPERKDDAPRNGHDNGLVDSGESNSGRMFRGAEP